MSVWIGGRLVERTRTIILWVGLIEIQLYSNLSDDVWCEAPAGGRA